MTGRNLFRGVLWALVALLFFGHLGAGWYFSGELIDDGFTPDAEIVVLPDTDVEIHEVSYETPVGEMDAWQIPADGPTWVIHVHGKDASPAEAAFLFEPLQEAGYPQLAITYRNDEGQPRDPSGYYQYGTTEWEDIQGALDYARANGAEDVVFSGFSTGAAHILAFSFRNNLDVVNGIVLDSPNLDFGDTVDYNAAQRDMPLLPMKVPPTVTWVAKFFTSLRIGVNWKSIDYVDNFESSLRVPVLIHHGAEDMSVPISQSVAAAEGAPDLVTLVQVPGADHVGSFEADPGAYVSDVLTFLDEVG